MVLVYDMFDISKGCLLVIQKSEQGGQTGLKVH